LVDENHEEDDISNHVQADRNSSPRPGTEIQMASLSEPVSCALKLPLSSSSPHSEKQCSRSDTCSLRWQKLINAASSSTAACDQGAQKGAVASQSRATKACVESYCTVPATHTLYTEVSGSDALCPTADAEAASFAAGDSCKPPKRQKKHCAPFCSSTISSPPRIYKDDLDYQRYFEESNDVSAWVRNTLLDR
jgi:hypothetical protein